MRSELSREVTVGATLAATLAAGLVLSPPAHLLVLACVVMMWLSGWTWRRGSHDGLRNRIASTFLVGVVGFAFVLLAGAWAGVPILVLAVAVAAACAAAVERARLGGAPIPAEGEARGRVAFDGTAHARGEPPRLPGTERVVAMWIARQGRRRWSSTGRVELRGPQGKVWLEPARARVRGAPSILPAQRTGNAARELDGADPSDDIQLWSVSDGDPLYVVGAVTLQEDPDSPSFRDAGRVNVFTGDVVVGMGQRGEALRHLHTRLLIAGGLAACAGGLALATRLGR